MKRTLFIASLAALSAVGLVAQQNSCGATAAGRRAAGAWNRNAERGP